MIEAANARLTLLRSVTCMPGLCGMRAFAHLWKYYASVFVFISQVVTERKVFSTFGTVQLLG
jgi:hypothetical protein